MHLEKVFVETSPVFCPLHIVRILILPEAFITTFLLCEKAKAKHGAQERARFPWSLQGTGATPHELAIGELEHLHQSCDS